METEFRKIINAFLKVQNKNFMMKHQLRTAATQPRQNLNPFANSVLCPICLLKCTEERRKIAVVR